MGRGMIDHRTQGLAGQDPDRHLSLVCPRDVEVEVVRVLPGRVDLPLLERSRCAAGGTTDDITVNDVYDQIATLTVRSAIYREYLQLVKTAEGWRILNALYMNVA